VPELVRFAFDNEIMSGGEHKRWLVTLGQFSTVRLERDTQIIIPIYDYGLPRKVCPGTNADEPCAIFEKIHFPVEEFFPPDALRQTDNYRDAR